MKPSLCLFTDSWEPSGMGQHMLLLAGELRSAYSISFVCHEYTSLASAARSLGYPVYDLPSEYTDLIELLRHISPQVFHCHAGIGWEGQYGVYAARMAGIKRVIRTEHLPFLLTDTEQYHAYIKCTSLVDALICVSHGARATFEKAGVEIQRLHTVQNGINIAPVSSPSRTHGRPAGLPENARLVLTVGRMTEQKGHSYLLDAARVVLKQHPEAHFMLVGSGPLEDTLRWQAASLGIERNVHFANKPVDVLQLMQECEIFVLPSLFEGLPLVALEAMSAGRPVAATRVCGTGEAVKDGETGLLVEPRDSEALAAAINKLLSDKALAQQLGAAGRARVEANFTAARMARETAQIYRRLLTNIEEAPLQMAITSEEPQDSSTILVRI